MVFGVHGGPRGIHSFSCFRCPTASGITAIVFLINFSSRTMVSNRKDVSNVRWSWCCCDFFSFVKSTLHKNSVFQRNSSPGIATIVFLANFSFRTMVSNQNSVNSAPSSLKMWISADIEERRIVILQIKITPTGFAVEYVYSKFLLDESVRFLAEKENQ